MIAIATTEHAAGTAWLLPRNCVASSPANVELCIPVHNEIVLQTDSSCLEKHHETLANSNQHIIINLNISNVPFNSFKYIYRTTQAA